MRSYVCGQLTAKLPKYNDLPRDVADNIIHAIAVNCAYTSRIIVSSRLDFVLLHMMDCFSDRICFSIATGKPR